MVELACCHARAWWVDSGWFHPPMMVGHSLRLRGVVVRWRRNALAHGTRRTQKHRAPRAFRPRLSDVDGGASRG